MALQFQTEPTRRRKPSREDHSGVRLALRPSEPPPPPPPPQTPFQATATGNAIADAIAADAGALPADLPALWQDFMDGRLRVDTAVDSPDRSFVFMKRAEASDKRLTRHEIAVVVRVLCGEQQKVIAPELMMAYSTASKWYTHGLDKLGLAPRAIPLPLILAAQGWAGHAPAIGARRATVRRNGSSMILLSVPKPKIAPIALTRAEEEVARRLVEGDSRWEIAHKRTTSAQTVACQLRGVYSKLRVSGRCALVHRGVELGWFA
jgi:DNA-binding NarL/FixJ family response regulator